MGEWIQLKGHQIELLHEALTHDFDANSLSRLLDFRLGRNLAHVTGPAAFAEVVSRVILRAGREIWLDELILAAAEERPGTEGLKRLVEELGLGSRVMSGSRPPGRS